MKNNIIKRAVSLLLALVCVMGVLPLSAFAAGLSTAPGSITQKSSDYMKIGGQSVRYRAASNTINNVGLPYVFDEQVEVPGFGATRALCAYQKGTLGPGANGQKWNFKNEVDNASLKVLLTYIYSHTYGNFTDAGNAIGLEHWNQYWSDIWFMVAQAMSWYYEHGIILDVNSNREGFIEQAAEEFVAAMKLYHRTYGQSSFITNWDAIDTHSIIDSADGGKTGNSAYDYVATGVNLVLDHPEYYCDYHLWIYEWDSSQPWKLAGQSGIPMQRLLIAVPNDKPTETTVRLTVKKLEAGTNKPIPGVTFKIESADGSGDFSITRETGADGTLTLTAEADGLTAGQYTITEEAAPEGYVAQTASQTVTVMPNSSVSNTFTFYNSTTTTDGDGSIRKVDADNPTVGIPGAVIRITSVKLDNGGSFMSEYTTKDGGYILKEDLDFSKLPTGSFIAEEITPPEGFILSSDVSKVKQPFVWDGEHDISLIFENSSKVKVQLKKVDESNNPLPGAIFVILRDGQIIGTEETKEDGTITVSNVTEGYFEFREVSAPAGFDCDRSPVGVHVSAEDLQGEQTIVVTKMNHHKRSLTITKRDTETGAPVPNTSFHIRGVNIGYENDVVTGADGKATISNMPSGCYEIEETDVPAPYILDTNNRRTVWIDAEKDQDVVADFVNSTKPGLRLLKLDEQTGKPVAGATFLIEEVDGGFTDRRQTGPDGLIVLEGLRPGAYKISEQVAAPNYVLDSTVHVVQLEENKTTTIELTNLVKPTLKILKVDSITGNPVNGAKFQIWRASGETKTGDYNDLGTFYSNEAGEIILEHTDPGWFKVSELEAPSGYSIKQADYEFYLAAGETKTVQVENTPLSALVVWKYDRVTGEAVEGAVFQVKYLSGTSGSGGTVIGTYRTGKNGSFTVTGLQAGAYVVEELASDSGHIIDAAPQTAYISGEEQAVVELHFGNSPKSSLLIRKVCATNPSVTLANAEFKVTYSDGSVIGDSNGIYRSDENGEVLIEDLEPNKSVIITEVTAPPGFIKDTQSVTIQTKPGRTVSVTMKNQPKGKLVIQKRDSQTNEPLSGAQFRISTAAGCEVGLNGVIGTSTMTQNGIFTTNSAGEITISNLAPGGYILTEIKAPDGGYVIDNPSTNVVIGQGGDTQTVIVTNTRKGQLIVEKYDSITKQPLKNAQFKITTASGELVPDNEGMTSSNGIYTTNEAGQIVLSKVLPDTYVISEFRAPDFYRADPTPQTVVVNAGDTQTVRFFDDPLCSLQLLKRDAVTKKPLANAEFYVRDSEGKAIGPNNGLYTTGADGTVTVTGLEPDSTIVVSESRAPTGYIKDETPKNIVVRSGVLNSLIFDDQPGTTLIIRKFIEGTENEPLSGVAFKVVDGAGAAVGPDDGVYYTDHAGEIVLDGIEPGTTVIAREIKSVEGFVLDGTPQDIKIEGGRVQQLTFWNKRDCSLQILKQSTSKDPLPGAVFLVTDEDGGAIGTNNGRYTSDRNGLITITGLQPGQILVVTEEKAPEGFVKDSTPKVIKIKQGPNSLIFENAPLCSLTLTKVDSTNGKPVPNTVFSVKDGNGNLIGRYTTGKDGTVTVTGLMPGSTVVVSEYSVPDGYVLDTTPQTITLKNGTGNSFTSGANGNVDTNPGGTPGNGSGNDLTFENDPTMTLTLHKYITGTKNEPLAGVGFKLTDGSGAPVGPSDGIYYTDSTGTITVEGLEPGTTVTAREISTVSGFVLDSTPKSVKIKAGKQAPELVFWNQRAGELVIRKLDKLTGMPLVGVEFELTYADGGYVDNANGQLSSNGLYKTNASGEIRITGITGTVVIKETRCLPGYTMDPGTSIQTVVVRPQETQTITVYNTPGTNLTIQKYAEGTTDPIQGVTFLVTDSSGQVVGPNNGEYVTDRNGRIVLTGLTPGTTITAKEIRGVTGFVQDSTPQSILIKEGTEGQQLTFYNKREGGVEIVKVDAADKTKRIPNTTFEVRKMDGGLVDTVTTGSDGRVHVNLDAGDYYIVETVAGEGYKINPEPIYFTVKDGKCTTLAVENKAFSGILIHKTDSMTGKGIYGVSFLLYDSTNKPVGQYTSDNSGYVYIEDLVDGGRYYLRELENPGYIPDTEMKTVYVKAGETTLIEWKNTPVTAQIQITKKSADYNSVNGLPAGTLLEGAVFEIRDKAGNLVDTIRSDSRGVATSKPLPLSRYTIKEVKAPANYGVSDQELTAYLEHAGQIVRFEVTNKSLSTGVSITKTGPKQIMAGQPVRYVFSDIANNSNVRLDSFYWRDTLPAEVRLDSVVTGTYNFPGTYKITYRVNGGEPRTLADNLSTSKNYTLAASATALGLASNERVTEIMFVFGQAPAGFAQVEKPMLYCTAVKSIASTSFVNVADVGGVHSGIWIQAVSRWVTTVYGKPIVPSLPKTGY